MFPKLFSMRKWVAVILLGTATVLPAHAQEHLDVISGDGNQQWLRYTDARNSLYHHLTDEALQLLEKRKASIARLSSADDWTNYQQAIRKALDEAVGPFPEKTPLNARVMGQVQKDAYRIEHIVFESQPGFYVTASMFIPASLKRRDKAPAVIYCSGHTPLGYRSETYQHIIVNLVRKGFIVFAFDPVGQGERLQYLDAQSGNSKMGGPTAEHSYPGSQAFIIGTSQARLMIWDGIRAVDYLLTRREVDAARIGITGRSGGGTQSAYIAAFDDRIHAVAPECYITSFERLLESIGPQDAEQNFAGGIAKGLDHGDLLIVRAPRPALMITTTGDFFSIQGARETAADVARAYSALGMNENFAMVEDDAGHASTKKNREAMYVFFQKHLNNPGNPADEEVELLSAEELRVTPSGQITSSLRGETIFDLNRRDAAIAMEQLSVARKNSRQHAGEVIAAARRLSGYRKPSASGEPVFTGRLQREGYVIEKYFFKGEGRYVIPYLRVVPIRRNGTVIVYLHPDGKSAEAGDEGQFEKLARDGFEIIAPDLPGVGELGNGSFHGDAFIGGVSHNTWYAALLIDRSIAGIQAGDISRIVDIAQRNGPQVYGVAQGWLGSALLHAAAFDERIRGVGLIEPLSAYRSLVTNRTYHSPFVMGAVAGQLKTYDLPDLAAVLAPRPLMIVRPLNGNAAAGSDEIRQDLDVVTGAYRAKGADDMLFIYDTKGSFYDHLKRVWPQ